MAASPWQPLCTMHLASTTECAPCPWNWAHFLAPFLPFLAPFHRIICLVALFDFRNVAGRTQCAHQQYRFLLSTLRPDCTSSRGSSDSPANPDLACSIGIKTCRRSS